jgi:hypothetical protein
MKRNHLNDDLNVTLSTLLNKFVCGTVVLYKAAKVEIKIVDLISKSKEI